MTDFFFGEASTLGPLPFTSDALEVGAWRPGLLRSMWSSASEAMLTVRPGARWYAEKLAVDETVLIDAGITVLRVDLVRDPRDLLASRRAFLAGGTEGWARDAEVVCAELMSRIDELDHYPPEVRLRYEDLAGDLAGTAERLAADLGVELRPEAVPRVEHHVTTTSVEASIGRWHRDLTSGEVEALAPIVKRLGYAD